MATTYFEDEIFESRSFELSELKSMVFVNCRFVACNLSDRQVLSSRFEDCIFEGCNLSMTKFPDTQMGGVRFENSKLTGANFKDCSDFLFSVSFRRSILDYAVFEKRKMKQTRFEQCSMKGTDLALADLPEAVFDRCDLTDAVFYSTNLKAADFSTSYGYTIDPNENSVKNAQFSLDGLPGLLAKYNLVIN